MKPKTARVIVTSRCYRGCKGCANGFGTPSQPLKYLYQTLKDYDEVCLTGGEPMLESARVSNVVTFLREDGYKGKIYLYTAQYDYRVFWRTIDKLDGFQFTLHYPASDQDIDNLRELNGILKKNMSVRTKSLRLCIDSRLYETQDLSFIDVAAWSSIRRMEWREDCPLPENETLYTLQADYE